ncbi:MAG: DNA modification methylase, partial [Brevundimonas sp.]|nr:DNA modification methylase [Brevundimonas sp.]
EMTEGQKRAYIIADNKLAENAGWDENLLRIEIKSLEALDLDFRLEVTGIETPELDILLRTEDAVKEEPAPEPAPGRPVSRVGDLWLLGRHRLLVGNSLNAESYAAVTDGEPAAAMFTDPPYNVPVDGHVCGLGKIRHEEFVMASGEMSPAEFRAFLETFMTHARGVMRAGAVAYVCMDWRHIADVIGAGETKLGNLINLCVWNKLTGGMGSLYRSQHELVPVFRVPGAQHRNNVELGRHGRNRTNVWDYTGVQARRGELKMHPTVKPVAMISDAIMDVTARGDLVLDPFAGSGSTLMAAEETGRRAACIELDPKYADVILRRFRDATGNEACHAVWDQTFSAIEAEMEAPADGK